MLSYCVFAGRSQELSKLWQAHRQLTENCHQQTELIGQLRQLHADTQQGQLSFYSDT